MILSKSKKLRRVFRSLLLTSQVLGTLLFCFPAPVRCDEQAAIIDGQQSEYQTPEQPTGEAGPTEYLLTPLGRDWLQEQGVDLRLLAVNDWWANVRGGNYRGVGSMGNLNVIVTVDTQKAGWWENGSFTLYGIWIYGQRPSYAVGDFQFTSSIDAPDPQLEPYEAFYEHTFLDGRLRWLAGIHDLSLDFAILDYGFTFINSSFYTPSTITQVPYSFYPNTSFGTRAIYEVTERTYAMLGFYDGQPATNQDIDRMDLSVNSQDGLYSIFEYGFKGNTADGHYTKLAFGVWQCTGEFTDIAGQKEHSNFGTYVLGERELWKEVEGTTQGLGAFFQVGQAQQDRMINPWYFGGGVRYKGLVPDRDEDVLGFGLAMATFGATAREAYPNTESSERTFELSYRAPINGWLTLTPDAQFVVDPSGNPELENDLILYVRSEINL